MSRTFGNVQLVGHPRLNELWLYTPGSKVREAVERMFPGIARR
jgi:hypothetical protein